MAVVVQANLALLRRAEARRRNMEPGGHDIHIPAPSRVDAFKESLIAPAVVNDYSDMELHLRLHELWGQYCAMRWLFQAGDHDADFSTFSKVRELECATSVEVKLTEVHAYLWRFRFEQRRRENPEDYNLENGEAEIAETIPATAFDKPAQRCSDEELLFAACQHAGMLAVLRWVMDPAIAWSAPGIMDVDDQPF